MEIVIRNVKRFEQGRRDCKLALVICVVCLKIPYWHTSQESAFAQIAGISIALNTLNHHPLTHALYMIKLYLIMGWSRVLEHYATTPQTVE